MDIYAPGDDGNGIFEVVLTMGEVAEYQEYSVLPRSSNTVYLEGITVHFTLDCNGTGKLQPLLPFDVSIRSRGRWLTLPTLLVILLNTAKQHRAGGGLFYSLPLSGALAWI